MNRSTRNRLRLITLAAVLPLLAACGGLLSGPPQRAIYRLSLAFAFPPDLPQVRGQLLVTAPDAPAGLDTVRIALSRSPVSLDYYANAEWTDRAPFLVQAALVEAFQKSAAVPAVAAESGGLHADFLLDTAIRDFQAVYDSSDARPHVVVALDARLVQMPSRKIIAHTMVRRDARATANTLDAIVQAYDAALGEAAVAVVSWTVSDPALSAGRASAIRWTRFVHAFGGGRTGGSARATE